MSSQPGKSYADISQPLLEAALGGHYRFTSLEDAYARLQQINRKFVTSRRQAPRPTLDSGPIVCLWVAGWNVAEAERTQGYRGHFALLSIEHAPEADGRFTIAARKLDIPLKDHPQRTRPPRANADWGHKTLRAVKTGKQFTTLEEAQAMLDRLHSDFPKTTIPGAGRLSALVYRKSAESTTPIARYTIGIEAEEDKFVLKAKERVESAVPKKKKTPLPGDKPTADTAPQGAFTAKVQARRARKAPPTSGN